MTQEEMNIKRLENHIADGIKSFEKGEKTTARTAAALTLAAIGAFAVGFPLCGLVLGYFSAHEIRKNFRNGAKKEELEKIKKTLPNLEETACLTKKILDSGQKKARFYKKAMTGVSLGLCGTLIAASALGGIGATAPFILKAGFVGLGLSFVGTDIMHAKYTGHEMAAGKVAEYSRKSGCNTLLDILKNKYGAEIHTETVSVFGQDIEVTSVVSSESKAVPPKGIIKKTFNINTHSKKKKAPPQNNPQDPQP
ncbi:MAG: hypothetical protein OXT65_09695 [Alphaproteobacteria bacterium]|nr:hypothetical protein [Alphaproteobacteria bacterium]